MINMPGWRASGSGMLLMVLAVLLLAACSDKPTEPKDESKVEVIPAYDTLFTREGTSYAIPDSIADIKKLRLYVGFQELTIDLVYEGRMYFHTPFDPISGVLRLYHGDVLQTFAIKHLTTIMGSAARSRQAVWNGGLGYPGEMCSIELTEPTPSTRRVLFIDGQIVAIDSILPLYEESKTGANLCFTMPDVVDTPAVILLVDGEPFDLSRRQALKHTGKFLAGREFFRIRMVCQDIWADNNIYAKVDTGVLVMPQPVARFDLTGDFVAQESVWKGDSVILQLTSTEGTMTEKFDIHLLPHPTKNYASGRIAYERVDQGNTYAISFDIERMHWTMLGRDYQLEAYAATLTNSVRNLKYRATWPPIGDEERVDRLIGGGGMQIYFWTR
jgi:hypothetical protein